MPNAKYQYQKRRGGGSGPLCLPLYDSGIQPKAPKVIILEIKKWISLLFNDAENIIIMNTAIILSNIL